MGQLVMIVEEALERLETKAFWGDEYYSILEKISHDLYPDYICTSPVGSYQYNEIILEKMALDLSIKRKKWWKR